MDISEKPAELNAGGDAACQPLGFKHMPHPAVQIFIWLVLVLAAQMLPFAGLLSMSMLLLLLSVSLSSRHFFAMLRRTRWILFSIFAIYAYVGTGELMLPQIGIFSPLQEGVMQGGMQLLRLLSILASLSLLLTLLSQSQLVSGLYVLFRPLSLLGLAREQIAVRLALTLRYAENTMKPGRHDFHNTIEYMLTPLAAEPENILLQVAPFSRLDWYLILLAVMVLFGVCL